jgi:uncharacterized protein YxjI
MQTFELTQRLLSIGPTYEVTALGQADVLTTIRGKLLTLSPKLTMVEGAAGATVAELTANVFKTKFVMKDASGKEVATLSFPLIQLKKSFVLSAGGQDYKAEGGFLGGEFKCVDAQSNTVMVIAKQASLRDKFAVSTNGALPRDVALLAAVAIDQKLFQDPGVDL